MPYLIVAVGGLIAGAVLDIYSSGLNLITLGLRVPRYKSVAVDGLIMIAGNVYILFIAQNFIGPFESFLSVLGVLLTAWVAVFLVDLAMFRQSGYREADLYNARSGAYHYLGGVNPPALIACLVAVVIGLGLITSSVSWLSWLGWWARGPFANSSSGVLVAFAVAAVLYGSLSRIAARAANRPVRRA